MPPTPYALISDLHANLEATDAVLADIDAQKIATIVCLGDLVGYGPDPEAVVDRVSKRAKLILAGNHDWALINRPLGFSKLATDVIEYTRDMMEPKFYHLFGKTRERWSFLEHLPMQQEDGDVTFVHASLRDPIMDYCFGDDSPMWNPEQVDEIMAKVKWLCFCGHTHFPVVIRNDHRCWYPKDGDLEHPLDRTAKYVINVGSVGQPRDGDPRACYAIFDGRSVRYRRVEYAVQKTREKILAIDAMEASLGERLLQGR